MGLPYALALMVASALGPMCRGASQARLVGNGFSLARARLPPRGTAKPARLAAGSRGGSLALGAPLSTPAVFPNAGARTKMANSACWISASSHEFP